MPCRSATRKSCRGWRAFPAKGCGLRPSRRRRGSDMVKKDYANLPYRACVGIALFNRDDKVFVGERVDNPGAWQMPQGGIDDGETIEQAFFRELREEVGTDKAEIIKIH